MSDHKITGSWSVPHGKKYPGQLDVNYEDGKIMLELFSSEYIDGSGINFMHDQVPRQIEYIWGYAVHWQITLYQCDWKGTSVIGEDLYVTKYEAKFKFQGVHLPAESEPFILSGKFSFPHLGSFYDASEAMRISASEFDYNEIDKAYRQNLIINDELELEFVSYIAQHLVEMNVNLTIEKYEYLIFKYKQEVPFSRLLKDAIAFRKMLSFSYSKPTLHCIHNVEIAHTHIRDQIDSVSQRYSSNIPVTNFLMNKNKEISRGILHQNHMVVSRWKMSKEQLNAVIIKWFANTHLYNIYEYYLDSNNWFQDSKDATLSIVMFNNRFLNLIQGLEDYHRNQLHTTVIQNVNEQFDANKKQVLKAVQNDPILKKWVNDTFNSPQPTKSLVKKLEMIVDHCASVTHRAFPVIDWSVFPKSAKDFRNKLSHGRNKEIGLGDRLHLDYQIAQTLLCVCILQSLEIAEIPKLIQLNLKLQQNIQEIKRLQTIYPPR